MEQADSFLRGTDLRPPRQAQATQQGVGMMEGMSLGSLPSKSNHNPHQGQGQGEKRLSSLGHSSGGDDCWKKDSSSLQGLKHLERRLSGIHVGLGMRSYGSEMSGQFTEPQKGAWSFCGNADVPPTSEAIVQMRQMQQSEAPHLELMREQSMEMDEDEEFSKSSGNKAIGQGRAPLVPSFSSFSGSNFSMQEDGNRNATLMQYSSDNSIDVLKKFISMSGSNLSASASRNECDRNMTPLSFMLPSRFSTGNFISEPKKRRVDYNLMLEHDSRSKSARFPTVVQPSNFAEVLELSLEESTMANIIESMTLLEQGCHVEQDSVLKPLQRIVNDKERRQDRFHKKKTSSKEFLSKSIKTLKKAAYSSNGSASSTVLNSSGQGCTIVVVSRRCSKHSNICRMGPDEHNESDFVFSREPVTRSNFGKWINNFMKNEGIS